jgi:hypothetical protein
VHPEPKIIIRIQLELQVLLRIYTDLQTLVNKYLHLQAIFGIHSVHSDLQKLTKIHVRYKNISAYILIYKYDKDTS